MRIRLAYALGGVSAAYLFMLAIVPAEVGWLFKWRNLLLVDGIYFAAGMLIYALHRHGPTVARMTGLVLFLASGCVPIMHHAGTMALSQFGLSDNPGPIGVLVWLGSVGAIVASIRWERRLRPRSAPVRGAVRAAGLATYPLYLLHATIGTRAMREAVLAGVPAPAALVLVLLSLTALSLLVSRWPEQWVRTALSEVFARIERTGARLHRARA